MLKTPRTRHHDGRFAKAEQALSASDALSGKQAEIAARTAGKESIVPAQTTTLHPIFADYVEDIRLRGKDPKTVSRAFYACRRFQHWLGDVGIDPKDVDERRLKQYVAFLRSTVANSSARSETEKIKAAYKYAVRIGILAANPAEYVETPALDDREPETYSNDELRKIRAGIMDDDDDLLFHGLAYTGMRRFELSTLKWSDVDLPNSLMRVMGKGAKLRKVPVHPRLAEVLVSRREKYGAAQDSTVFGKGGSTRNLNHRLVKLLDRAGVDGGNRPAHRFRATVQCSLYEEGVREDVIDKILGWAPKNIRQRYYSRVRDESAHEAILRLYRSDPLETTRMPVEATQTPAQGKREVA